jgi:hypothetical protein
MWLQSHPAGNSEGYRRLVMSTVIASYIGPRRRDDSNNNMDSKSGLYHGRGRAELKGGQVYEGPFEDGLMHGTNAIVTFADGTRYEGDFNRGIMTGSGKITWSDGSVYEGDIVDGYRHGRGVFTDQNVPCIYDGLWNHGMKLLILL